MPIDHVLKLYSETFRSPYLHYGFWDNPHTVDPKELSLRDIVAAQERYIEHLASFIPERVESILDVGSGIGGNAAFLLEKGYSVHALSPDKYQESVIHEKFNGTVPFYRTKFENFIPPKEYDLILESESACYIKIIPGFEVARKAIKEGGYLLVSDYFIHHNDSSGDWHIKASHDERKYLDQARAHGFKLLNMFDQTDNTMPTLEGMKVFMERFIYPIMEFSTNYMNKNYPFMLKVMRRAFGKKVDEKMLQLALLDKEVFKRYKRYMIYLFQKEV